MSNPDPEAALREKALRRLYLSLFLRGRGSRGLKKDAVPKSLATRLGWTLLLYAAVGCASLTLLGQPLFSLSVYLHGATLFLLGMFVASSAGEILFNKEEAEILLHRPVTPRELLRAKVSVLVRVSLWLALAFNLAGMIAGTLGKGGSPVFAPAHLAATAASALFCTGSVVLIYQLCLRWFGRERLDGLMTASQIGLALVIVLGGQVAPHLLKHMPESIVLTGHTWWLALLPPVWFAGIDEVLTGRGNPGSWCLAAVGVTVTSVILGLAFGRLAASYGSGMQVLGETRPRPAAAAGKERLLERLLRTLPLRWWLRDPVERAGFLLTAAYLTRDRDVKLRVYPGIAPVLVMPVVFLVNGAKQGDGDFMIVLAGCYLGMISLMAQGLLRYSQQWQATDLLRLAPLPGPGSILSGSRKAVAVMLVLPAIILVVGAVLLIRRHPGDLAALLPGLLALPLLARYMARKPENLPLSAAGDEARAAGRGLTFAFAMFASMGIGGAAMLAREYGYYPHFLIAEGILVAGLCVMIDRGIRRLKWLPLE